MLPQWFGHALRYLGYLVVFAAVFAAVLGETRFQNRQGLRSITKSGWAAMALVVAGLLMSSLGTRLTVRGQTPYDRRGSQRRRLYQRRKE